jgi:hypothetical protein
MRFLLPTVVFFSGFTWAFADDAKPAAPQLLYRVYPNLPVDLFRANTKSPLEAHVVDSGGNAATQFDMRDYFADQGFKFKAGEEAVYDPHQRTLVVHASSETLDNVAQLGIGGFCGIAPDRVFIEVSLVEFSGTKVLEGKNRLEYESLRKAAGDSWRVLSRIALVTKSGQRSLVAARDGAGEISGEKPQPVPSASAGTAPADTSTAMAPGEFGTRMEVEAIVGPDDATVDVNLVYSRRVPGRVGANMETTTTATVMKGTPTVLSLSSAPSEQIGAEPAMERALILEANLSFPHWEYRREGKPVEPPESPAQPEVNH